MNTAVKIPDPVQVKMPAVKPERNYGIDLLRALSIFMVVVLHISTLVIAKATQPYTYVDDIAVGFESITYCAVNIFAMISGYVCFGKKFRLSRAANVWVQGLTYYLGIFGVLAIICGTVDSRELIEHFFPVTEKAYWYLSAYILLLFLMPLLDRIIDSFDKKEHLMSLVLVTLFAEIGLTYAMAMWPFGEGYTAMWLAAMYLFGAYFRKYGLLKLKKRSLLLIFFACAAVMFASKYSMRYITLEPKYFGRYDRAFFRYTALPCVIEAIVLFNFFAKLRITGKKIRAFISFFSSASLAVYLIHSHPHILKYYFPKLSFVMNYRIRYLIPMVILLAAAIYIVCALVEYLRKIVFKYLRIDRFVGFVSDKIQALFLYFFRKV